MPDAFYEPDGDRYRATELTRGPWDPGSQHAGPPSGLIARELERLGGDGDCMGRIGRITLEILRPVPIAALAVSARVLKPGRRVELCEATLSDDAGELMRATAWRLRTEPIELPAGIPGVADEDPPGPESAEAGEFFPTGEDVGYHSAMDYRFVTGGFLEPGPATVWMRMRVPLVAGEEPTPLQRALIAADVGNGISAVLDWRSYVFINVDLTVHFERMPEGEWVCVDAVSRPQPSGIGTAESELSDERGRIGRAAQSLLLAQR